MKDSILKQDDNSSTYALLSNSNNTNMTENGHKIDRKVLTVENLFLNLNKKLTQSKKKYLNILSLSPNLDKDSLDIVN